MPDYDENGKWDGFKKTMILTTKVEYFGLIDQLLQESGRRYTMIEALDALGVCAAGFVDKLSAWIARLESAASAYYALPAPGGILNQPMWLFEGFETVRRARDDYYDWKKRKA